jgi:hypothetical protein
MKLKFKTNDKKQTKRTNKTKRTKAKRNKKTRGGVKITDFTDKSVSICHDSNKKCWRVTKTPSIDDVDKYTENDDNSLETMSNDITKQTDVNGNLKICSKDKKNCWYVIFDSEAEWHDDDDNDDNNDDEGIDVFVKVITDKYENVDNTVKYLKIYLTSSNKDSDEHKEFVRKNRREILRRVLTKQNEPDIEKTLNDATNYWKYVADNSLLAAAINIATAKMQPAVAAGGGVWGTGG